MFNYIVFLLGLHNKNQCIHNKYFLPALTDASFSVVIKYKVFVDLIRKVNSDLASTGNY